MIEVLPLGQHLYTHTHLENGYATTDPNAVSHVAIRIMENPKMETNRKFLCMQPLAIRPYPARLCCEVTILAILEPFPYGTYLSDPRENLSSQE